jgi:hypothetical protein
LPVARLLATGGLDERLHRPRYIAILDQAPAQLVGDVLGDLARPALGGIEGDDAYRMPIWPSIRLRISVSRSVASASVSRQAWPSRGPKSSNTRRCPGRSRAPDRSRIHNSQGYLELDESKLGPVFAAARWAGLIPPQSTEARRQAAFPSGRLQRIKCGNLTNCPCGCGELYLHEHHWA